MTRPLPPSCRRPSPRWKRTCPRATSRPFPTPPLPKTCGRRCAWRACWASPATVALRGMRAARPDVGMCGPFHVGQCTVINAFAANEPQSSQELMEATLRTEGLEDAPPVAAVQQPRRQGFPPAGLCAVGAPAGRAGRAPARDWRKHRARGALLCPPRRHRRPTAPGSAPAWLESLGAQRCAVLCLGNIRGAGLEMIEILLQEDAHQARKEGTSCCNKPSA